MAFGGHRRKQFGSKKITGIEHIAQMKTFLHTARSLDAVTIDSLRRMYGVDARTAEYELTIARQARG